VKLSKPRTRDQIPQLAFNQQEAAQTLGVSVAHFERHVKPELPVTYSGSLRLYSRVSLEAWLAEHTERRRRVA
jgi:hypothetical protein